MPIILFSFIKTIILFSLPNQPKTKKINFSDSESGDENFASRRDRNPPTSARGGGRAKASVKYNFGDDDSDSDY